MRIGVIGPVRPDYFADNILVALSNMGYEALSLGSARPRPTSRTARGIAAPLTRIDDLLEGYQHSIVRRARRWKPDLILSVEGDLLPRTVARLRDLGARLGLWFPDPVTALTRQLAFAAPYDALFFKDPLLAERVRDTTGLRAFYLPEACNPIWHYPTSRETIDPHVLLVGNLPPSRALLLEKLHRAGLPLCIHSSGFPRWLKGLSIERLIIKPPIYRHEKAKAFRRAAVVLNNLQPFEMSSVNCRVFEATASGAVVLCEDRAALADLFKVGEELIAFRTVDELIERCKTILASPDEYTEMGDAAAKRALREHTYQTRLERLLKLMTEA